MVSEIFKFLWELLIPYRHGLFGSKAARIDWKYLCRGPLNIGPHGLDLQDFNTVQHLVFCSRAHRDSNSLSLGHISPAL